MKYKILRIYLFALGGGKERFYFAMKHSLPFLFSFLCFVFLTLYLEYSLGLSNIISESLVTIFAGFSFYYFHAIKAVRSLDKLPDSLTRVQKRLFAFDKIFLKKMGILMLIAFPLFGHVAIIHKVSNQKSEKTQYTQIKKPSQISEK